MPQTIWKNFDQPSGLPIFDPWLIENYLVEKAKVGLVEDRESVTETALFILNHQFCSLVKQPTIEQTTYENLSVCGVDFPEKMIEILNGNFVNIAWLMAWNKT